MGPGAARVLVIGYGNPGRLDDGLGPALAAALEELKLPGVTVEANYQLTVEDAREIAEHDVVVFADASLTGPAPFSFRRIEPKAGSHFSSHIVAPEAVLALAHELFGGKPEAYVLGIRGYAFDEFGESLSERARANLAAALEFLQNVVGTRSFREAEAKIKKQSVVETIPSNGVGPCTKEST